MACICCSTASQSLALTAQEVGIGRVEQDVGPPDDYHVEGGVDRAIGLVQRAVHRLPLRFGQVDEGLQPAGYFAQCVDQVGEEFEFHNRVPYRAS